MALLIASSIAWSQGWATEDPCPCWESSWMESILHFRKRGWGRVSFVLSTGQGTTQNNLVHIDCTFFFLLSRPSLSDSSLSYKIFPMSLLPPWVPMGKPLLHSIHIELSAFVQALVKHLSFWIGWTFLGLRATYIPLFPLAYAHFCSSLSPSALNSVSYT